MPSDGREWEQGLFVHQVLAWAKQHQQRLAGALAGLIAKQELLEALLAWLQWAETTLSDRDKEVIPQEIEEVKALIGEHQVTDVTPARLLRRRPCAHVHFLSPSPLCLTPPRPWSFSRFAGVSCPFQMLFPLGPIKAPPLDGLSPWPPPAPLAGSSPCILSPGPPLPSCTPIAASPLLFTGPCLHLLLSALSISQEARQSFRHISSQWEHMVLLKKVSGSEVMGITLTCCLLIHFFNVHLWRSLSVRLLC